MKQIKFTYYEYIQGKHGKQGHFKTIECVREYEDERDNDLCTVCKFPAYPECKKNCRNYERLLKQDMRECAPDYMEQCENPRNNIYCTLCGHEDYPKCQSVCKTLERILEQDNSHIKA